MIVVRQARKSVFFHWKGGGILIGLHLLFRSGKDGALILALLRVLPWGKQRGPGTLYEG